VSAKELIINAGNHDRRHCPVSVTLDSRQGVARLIDAASGQEVRHQCDGWGDGKVRLSWVLDQLAKGQSKTYRLEYGRDCQTAAGGGVELQDMAGERVDVCVRGVPFTSYYYTAEYARPFLYPVIGPYGDSVTRHYPMKELPHERRDHPHHRSIWVAYGDVSCGEAKNVDNWSELEGHGRIVQREFVALASGSVVGCLCTNNDWVSRTGQKVLSERRCLIFYNLPASVRMIDFDLTFTATEGDVLFTDTKEGGLVSVRVASSMDVPVGGRITNAYGGINEAETWGKRAHWCDYSGPVNDNVVGIAVFDHPTSFRYPTYWHVRDYGLMTANCFGLSHFYGDESISGNHILPAGQSLHFAYRVYIHPGDAEEGRVAEKYHDYINPPTVELK